MWAQQAQGWIDQGALLPPDQRPWLTRLTYCPPPTGQRLGNSVSLPFSSRLRFAWQPYYAVPEALATLHFQMRRERWVTSVFRPYPFTPLDRKLWAYRACRFAIPYRLRTAQRERKAKFEALVKARHKQGKSVREIARAAVKQGLWPYGTPRSTRTCDYDPVLNCERAVYRILNKMASGRLR